MGKGRRHARKRQELEREVDSDVSLSDGEFQERRRREAEAEEAGLKGRLDRIKAGYINKQKTLVLSSRGITHRYRHLMLDILQLLPHARKDSKLDTKQKLFVLNEIADMKDCSNCIFFEVRKGTDLYLWFAKVPNGPSIKFQVLNGNCLKGSRPFLSFDAGFEKSTHTQLMKSLLSQIFGTPKNHPRSRPFIDHVFSFSLLGDKIWFRNFQIAEEVNDGTKKIEKTLVEIGPRFVLDPIRILSGGFSGAVLWDNPEYLTPSAERSLKTAEEKKERLLKERKERKQEQRRHTKQSMPGVLDDVFADSEEERDEDDQDNSDMDDAEHQENGMDIDEDGSELASDDDEDEDGMDVSEEEEEEDSE